MIGVDWGTSSLRAYRMDAAGTVLDRHGSAQGILNVPDSDFAGALRTAIAPWLALGERHVLLSGMIGSRQGWIEAPYLPCPAGAAEIGAALVRVPFEGADVLLVPGLADSDASGTPEVMRGEETQIIGVLGAAGEATACLPGSHSKWARVANGRIASFRTYFSGEAFAALRSATILGRMMKDGPTDLPAFDRGLARADDPGHLLNHLFGVRTLGLFHRLGEDESASYLSGLLIGHEVRAALPPDAATSGAIHLIGAAPLCALYARAIARLDRTPVIEDTDAAARGLHSIGASAPWN